MKTHCLRHLGKVQWKPHSDAQSRRLKRWSRWVTLAMFAHAFLAVVRADEHARQPASDDLVPLSCNEIQRLFITLSIRPLHDAAHRLGWSDWRRRHSMSTSVGPSCSGGVRIRGD